MGGGPLKRLRLSDRATVPFYLHEVTLSKTPRFRHSPIVAVCPSHQTLAHNASPTQPLPIPRPRVRRVLRRTACFPGEQQESGTFA
jgi:hypothetical protein